jgi:dolichol-phosphate mannosyltransferase
VESISETVLRTVAELERADIEHEILVVDDASSDNTAQQIAAIAREHPTVWCARSHLPPGFGHAVRAGLELYTGDAVAIMMADLSDSPNDLVRYYRALEEGYDCVFGSRFIRGGGTEDYPRFKLVLNRIVNAGIRMLFRRHHQCLQGVPTVRDRSEPTSSLQSLQPHRRTSLEGRCPGIQLQGGADHLDQSSLRSLEAQASGDGQQVPLHHFVRVAGASPESR